MFGHLCESCGKGVVKAKVFPKYMTKIYGQHFEIENAVVGICEECGKEHFLAEETNRWEELYLMNLSYDFCEEV